MEYCPNGDLEQHMERYKARSLFMKEKLIWVYLINILEGLVALHSKGICHRGEQE